MPTCEICHLNVVSRFKRHHQQHVHKYKCDLCNYTYKSKSQLCEHIKRKHRFRPFLCFCGRSFTKKKTLIIHYRIHIKEKPFQCTICNRCFNQAIHLYKHVCLNNTSKCIENKQTNDSSLTLTRVRTMLWLLIKNKHQQYFDQNKSINEILNDIVGIETNANLLENEKNFIEKFQIFYSKLYANNCKKPLLSELRQIDIWLKESTIDYITPIIVSKTSL
ncbi:unknown [Neodiprion lecontei nucleopolyhedrovirus]|uniref:C2H2-type domain-containing protein n=1 Tax=Neodiprion lecontei nucleopolyhedrovirus (strain Canada) TaxID=654906 RepID=Q6JPB9_NPVNC|nr:unknown [Neodiprion lecontei nucleopolyhedrovirus]AAQ99097.1 unknown [Neodiprion lecontei nucleopolyhedrovirus]